MKILFIFDQMLEEIGIYEATGVIAELAAQCDGQFINGPVLAQDSAILKLMALVLWDTETGDPLPPHPEFVKIEDRSQACGPYDRIVVAGFLP